VCTLCTAQVLFLSNWPIYVLRLANLHLTQILVSILGGSILGVKFLDPLAGLLVSVMILKAGAESGYQRYLDCLSRSYISPWFIIISCKSKWFVCVWDWHLNKFLLLWCLLSRTFWNLSFFLKKPNNMLMKKEILMKHKMYLIRQNIEHAYSGHRNVLDTIK
jgi:hypothetical protein